MAKFSILALAAAVLALAAIREAGCATAPTSSPVSTPVPAPAPAPAWVNITQVLVYAGDFSTFVSLLQKTGTDLKFQGEANQTQVGITIFAPTNDAFKAKPAATLLPTLTSDQMAALLQYHALTRWAPLQALQNSAQNQTTTFATYNAGGKYVFNVTDEQGTVEVITPWTTANITSTLFERSPISIFAINRVLLPVDLFGLPAPAPAPAPDSGAPATSPGPAGSSSTLASSTPAGNDGNLIARPLIATILLAFLIASFLLH